MEFREFLEKPPASEEERLRWLVAEAFAWLSVVALLFGRLELAAILIGFAAVVSVKGLAIAAWGLYNLVYHLGRPVVVWAFGLAAAASGLAIIVIFSMYVMYPSTQSSQRAVVDNLRSLVPSWVSSWVLGLPPWAWGLLGLSWLAVGWKLAIKSEGKKASDADRSKG